MLLAGLPAPDTSIEDWQMNFGGRVGRLTIDECGLKHGGLMRCCIKTLSQVPPDKTFDVLSCNWCSNQMVLRGKYWEWLRPAVLGGIDGVSTEDI